MKKVKNIMVNYLVLWAFALSLMTIIIAPIPGLLGLASTVVIYFLDPWDQKTIKVKYFDDRMKCLEKISVGDWIDLRSAEDVVLKAGEYHTIPLGVGMILPDGYEAHIVPRSSTFKNFGILMACSGIIDNSYSGDNDQWLFGALAMRDTVIRRGDRICQFRIVRNQPSLKFEIVSRLRSISRGGIGSTGVK